MSIGSSIKYLIIDQISGAISYNLANLLSDIVQSSIWGANASYDGGTVGDWYVDNTVMSSGDGTTPETAFKTVTEARNATSTGETILIRNQSDIPYREQFSLTAEDDFTFKRYSKEIPEINAFEILTGLTACVVGDEPIVGDGSVDGSTYASCYKATLSQSGDLLTNLTVNELDIFEDGQRVPLVYDRAYAGTLPAVLDDPTTFHTADSFGVDGVSGFVESITDASVFASYSQAQIEAAFVMYRSGANDGYRSNITSYASNTATLATEEVAPDGADLWALYNGGNLTQGTWMWRQSGDTITVYIYPSDADNITSNIEYSAREYVVNLANANAMQFHGINFYGGTSNRLQYGFSIGHVSHANVDARSGHIITNCMFGRNRNLEEDRGAVYLSLDDTATFENNTIEQAGGFGLYVANSQRTMVKHNYFYQCKSAGWRIAGASSADPTIGTVVERNKCEDGSVGIHANLANLYQGTLNTVVHANSWVNCNGYFTWQRTNDLIVSFNDFATSSLDYRSVVDQNDTNGVPTGDDEIYFFNNICRPHEDSLTGGYAVDLGDVTDPPDYYIYNNIMNGLRRPSGAADYAAEEYNLLTHSTSNWTIDNSSETVTAASIYTAPGSDNFSFIDSSRAGKKAKDLSSLITSLKAWYNTNVGVALDCDFTKDCNGDTIANDYVGAVYPGFVDDDTTIPAISSRVPAHSGSDIAIDADIVITFAERIKFGSGTITLYDVTGDSAIEVFDPATDIGTGAGTMSIDDNELTIRPTDDFDNSISVDVRSTAGYVLDMNDNEAGAVGTSAYRFGTAIATSYNTVDFPGSAWLERDGALTGASDGKEMTLYICYEPGEDSENHRLLNTSPNYYIYSSRTNTNKIDVGVNGVVSMLDPSATATVANGRRNILASIDTANGYAILTVDGVTVVDKSPTADALIPFSSITDMSIMALVGGANSTIGEISAFYLSDVHVDVESGSVQDTFFDSVTGDPVLSGVATPLAQFSGAASGWTAGTNEGSGGNYVKKGAGSITDI